MLTKLDKFMNVNWRGYGLKRVFENP